MKERVRKAGFGDFVLGLRDTSPHYDRECRYALMERWNQGTHTFVFPFGEMTVTPADLSAISGLHFGGEAPNFDARYRSVAEDLCESLLGLRFPKLVRSGRVAYAKLRMAWIARIRDRVAAWRADPAREGTAPAFTREECDQGARAFLYYIISAMLLLNTQNTGDAAVLVALRDLSTVEYQDWASPTLAHLYHGLDAWTQGTFESSWIYSRWLEVRSFSFVITVQYFEVD